MDQADLFHLQDAVAVLERTPLSLSHLLAGLPQLWVNTTEGHGSWSPYEVVSHLINAEYTNWLPRVHHILTRNEQPFAPFNRTPHLDQQQERSADDLLVLFAQLRQENIAILKHLNLSNADMSRSGLHPDFGTVTLGQLLAAWVVHDLNHIGQIVSTMAKVYTNAVGPWKAYLSILQSGSWSEE